jgi:hypothetical protein
MRHTVATETAKHFCATEVASSRGSKPSLATQTANTPNVAIEAANLLWLHEQQICLRWLPPEGAKVITQEVWTANDWATQGQA